ncbi:MAG: hypothetical protein M5U26_20270 [Planctomycetota bacterium]|nr:hypothetical protein [Planctomycetota bacterium]
MRSLHALVLAAALASAGARADTVTLTDGSVREGTVIHEDQAAVTLEMRVGGMRGRVVIPRHEIASIKKEALPADPVETQAAKLRQAAEALDGAAAGRAYVALGDHYAERLGYSAQAREAYAKALQADPENADARKILGYVKTPAGWEAVDDERRARGLVPLGEGWVKPGERAWMIDRRHQEETGELKIGPRQEPAFSEAEIQRRLNELKAAEAYREAGLRGGEQVLARNGFYDFGDEFYIGSSYAPYYVDGVGIRYGNGEAFFGTVGYDPYSYAYPYHGGYAPRRAAVPYALAPASSSGSNASPNVGSYAGLKYAGYGYGYPDGSYNRHAPAYSGYYVNPSYTYGRDAAAAANFKHRFGYSPGIVYSNKNSSFAFGTNFGGGYYGGHYGGYGYGGYGGYSGYGGGYGLYFSGGSKNFKYSVGIGGFSGGYSSGGFSGFRW